MSRDQPTKQGAWTYTIASGPIYKKSKRSLFRGWKLKQIKRLQPRKRCHDESIEFGFSETELFFFQSYIFVFPSPKNERATVVRGVEFRNIRATQDLGDRAFHQVSIVFLQEMTVY